MNDSLNDTTSRKRPGGQPGNTNGQRHGLFSTQAPPTVQELRAMADAAIEEGDVTQLQRIERAAKFHAAHTAEPHTATSYRQAEHMIRAARAMLDYDSRQQAASSEQRAERSEYAMTGEGADDWPVPEPFADDGPEETGITDPEEIAQWITQYQPVHDQPALDGMPDPPPAPPSIFTGSRAARGHGTLNPGGQDEFPAAERSRRRH